MTLQTATSRGYIASHEGLFVHKYSKDTNSNLYLLAAGTGIHILNIDFLKFDINWGRCKRDFVDIYRVQEDWRSNDSNRARFCRSNTTDSASYFLPGNGVTLNFQSRYQGPWNGGFLIQYKGTSWHQ